LLGALLSSSSVGTSVVSVIIGWGGLFLSLGVVEFSLTGAVVVCILVCAVILGCFKRGLFISFGVVSLGESLGESTLSLGVIWTFGVISLGESLGESLGVCTLSLGVIWTFNGNWVKGNLGGGLNLCFAFGVVLSIFFLENLLVNLLVCVHYL